MSSVSEWRISNISNIHSHLPQFDDNLPPDRPPTAEHERLIAQAIETFGAGGGSLTRTSIRNHVNKALPDHPLNPRQVSNIMNKLRLRKVTAMAENGGNFPSIIKLLLELSAEDPGWVIELHTNERGEYARLFVMSPEQVSLAQRYSDVIINDNALGRNIFHYALGIFVVIDGRGASRNLAFGLSSHENIDSHRWMFSMLFKHIPQMRERVIFSDHDPALEAALKDWPDVIHKLCLHHILENLKKNLRGLLGHQYAKFSAAFWAMQLAISPDAFTTAWDDLVTNFPATEDYLNGHLWDTRTKWGRPWVATRFTCGVRTTGRVESENKENRKGNNTKTSVYDLVVSLLDRIKAQSEQAALAAREVSCLSAELKRGGS